MMMIELLLFGNCEYKGLDELTPKALIVFWLILILGILYGIKCVLVDDLEVFLIEDGVIAYKPIDLVLVVVESQGSMISPRHHYKDAEKGVRQQGLQFACYLLQNAPDWMGILSVYL